MEAAGLPVCRSPRAPLGGGTFVAQQAGAAEPAVEHAAAEEASPSATEPEQQQVHDAGASAAAEAPAQGERRQ